MNKFEVRFDLVISYLSRILNAVYLIVLGSWLLLNLLFVVIVVPPRKSAAMKPLVRKTSAIKKLFRRTTR
ncbi:hypothetical protein GA0061099_1007241 [Bradyrhizobium yuanmingense]|uniref:Uncharacterized protein n=1 Tax=Bradyrhizobium yuanmingense TaxID=108015 RepID=A0A1C3WTB5_9BRAD|nr:hypothetical protein IQ15_04999 [Bradyrhizobium yuanmingense]SCB43287.1 hypothetical protein GA0061099_1007241 [Bradyrhizobium yuanmingense]